jgi:hypothetical protein
VFHEKLNIWNNPEISTENLRVSNMAKTAKIIYINMCPEIL